MDEYAAYLSAASTLLGLVFFIGIVWWAYSSHRKAANDHAASMPFELPEEFEKDKS